MILTSWAGVFIDLERTADSDSHLLVKTKYVPSQDVREHEEHVEMATYTIYYRDEII